jgi:predicted MFS family arabinose efflux permease
VLAGILGAEICWSVAMLAFESLLPLRLEELLGSGQRAGAVVGPVAALGWALFAVGTWLAGLVSRRSVAGAAMLGRGLNGVGVLLMAAAAGPVGLVTAYLFTYSMHGLNGPPHGALLHREASSSNRTTVLSMNSMVASLAFGVASPIVGLLAERTSIAAAMAVVGVVGLVGVVGYLPARRTEGHPLR